MPDPLSFAMILPRARTLVRTLAFLVAVGPLMATDLDTVGVHALRALVPSLTGAGVRVAQAEAPEAANAWQVNPATLGQPTNLFTWTGTGGTSGAFPNALGLESAHADSVGYRFYGLPDGVAPGVMQMDNYDANRFLVLIQNKTSIAAKVVNQSFTTGSESPSLDRAYDIYVASYNTIIISGVGNGGPPTSPATAYNGLGVGVLDGDSSVGPTADGRSKPDLTAPGTQTSFSTPLVSGIAALLVQAGTRNDGGPGTAANSTDACTVKALLLNGADKPPGWTNSPTRPLDARYGAGLVNAFHAHRQLRAGKRPFIVSTTGALDAAHPPPVNATNVLARRGWDFTTINSTVTQERVNHYFFDLSAASNRLFTLRATLVWNRHQNETTINDLDLFLYHVTNATPVLVSTSAVDNVEHLYATNLPAGRYDLQVLKRGGTVKKPTGTETYALAFDFGPPDVAELVNAQVGGDQFHARLTGEAFTAYVVEAATNLVNWLPVLTNTATAPGFFDFTDPQPATLPARFYRAVWAP